MYVFCGEKEFFSFINTLVEVIKQKILPLFLVVFFIFISKLVFLQYCYFQISFLQNNPLFDYNKIY